jgi:hypothetical protein
VTTRKRVIEGFANLSWHQKINITLDVIKVKKLNNGSKAKEKMEKECNTQI